MLESIKESIKWHKCLNEFAILVQAKQSWDNHCHIVHLRLLQLRHFIDNVFQFNIVLFPWRVEAFNICPLPHSVLWGSVVERFLRKSKLTIIEITSVWMAFEAAISCAYLVLSRIVIYVMRTIPRIQNY